MNLQEQLYFDPFAEAGNEFSATESFDAILDRYQNQEIEHDYTADQFVADTKNLLLDALFTDQFMAFQAITESMHQLCGHDQAVQQAFEEHFDHPQDEGSHDDETDQDGKKKKKKRWAGWLKGWVVEAD